MLPSKFDIPIAINESKESDEGKLDESSRGSYQSTSSMYKLANIIANGISIPEKIGMNMNNTVAKTRFTKDSNGWSIRKIKGNRYLRAILYNVLSDLQNSVTVSTYLKFLPIKEISLSVEYKKPLGLYYTGDKNNITIFDNEITITLIRRYKSKYISFADTGNQKSFGIDLVKTYSLIKEMISPEFNLAVEKIKRSPAYSRPTGITNFLKLN